MAKNSTTAPKAPAKATKAPAAKSTRGGGNHDTAEGANNGGDTGTGKNIQHKPTLGEALAGDDKGLGSIGTGSAVETAPIIRAAVVQPLVNDREIRQGDEVILHTRSLLNGKLENPGVMLKANQDGTIAVRVPLQSGGTRDFSPVYNGPQNGEDWFSAVAEPTGVVEEARATEEAEAEAVAAEAAAVDAAKPEDAKVDDGKAAE